MSKLILPPGCQPDGQAAIQTGQPPPMLTEVREPLPTIPQRIIVPIPHGVAGLLGQFVGKTAVITATGSHPQLGDVLLLDPLPKVVPAPEPVPDEATEETP